MEERITAPLFDRYGLDCRTRFGVDAAFCFRRSTMRILVSFGAVAVLVAALAVPVSAQTWPVGLTSTLQFTSPAVGPASLGGLTFDLPANQLLLVGGAAGSTAAAYAYTPIRDPATSRITGLSAGTLFLSMPNADGGLALHAGTLFWATYPNHQVGQYNTVTTASSNTVLPAAFSTTGGLTIVPAGYPNAGTLLVSSYSYGDIYAIPLTPAANGLFTLGAATLYANMPQPGTEGLEFVSTGPLAGRLLAANYNAGTIDAVTIDPSTGLPVGGPSTPVVTTVISSLSGAEGLGIDPVTGDLFISSYNLGTLFRVDGFNTFTALAADFPAFSIGGGATVNLYVRAGSSHANRLYALAASGSGTVPGTLIGAAFVPLNVDAVTNFVIMNWNTPLFTNFVGNTNASGAALATINIPPLVIGAPIGLDFAGALVNPVDFGTNAVHIMLLP
jgi:hypothetical protein